MKPEENFIPDVLATVIDDDIQEFDIEIANDLTKTYQELAKTLIDENSVPTDSDKKKIKKLPVMESLKDAYNHKLLSFDDVLDVFAANPNSNPDFFDEFIYCHVGSEFCIKYKDHPIIPIAIDHLDKNYPEETFEILSDFVCSIDLNNKYLNEVLTLLASYEDAAIDFLLKLKKENKPVALALFKKLSEDENTKDSLIEDGYTEADFK